MNQAPLPKGLVAAPLPKELPSPTIKPGRRVILDRHAKNLVSGNKAKQARSLVAVSKLPPNEKAYVHAKAQAPPPNILNPGKGIMAREGRAQLAQLKQAEKAPARMARAQKLAQKASRPIENSPKAYEHAAHVLYEASPIPGAVNAFSHPSEFVGGDQARVERQNRIQSHAEAGVAEALTGYKEIKNIAHNPAAGGLALAGILPFGKLGELGRTVATGVRAAQEGRTAEEAASHIVEATKEAKAKGFGDVTRAPHEPPRVAPGKNSSATGGELGKQVREALAGRVDTSKMGRYEAIGAKTGIQSAGTARNAQEALRAPERAARAGRAAEAMKVGGTKGYHAALKQLKGPLPKVDFQGFKEFDQKTLDAMHTFIQQHEGLRPYEKVRAMASLQGAVRGKVPTASEQKLLERVFGRDTTKQIADSIPFWKKAKNLGLELLNVPRALMASFDLSAPFRQGLMAGMHNPAMFAKNFAPMLRSFKSERVYQGVMNGIYEHPLFPLAQKAKLAITDIGLDPHGAPLSQREEQFMSNLAERIPGIGHAVRASDRAYTGFLNKMRMDMFTRLTQQAAENGHDIHDQKVIESIAKFVNSATGRGDLGALQKHAVTLNTLLFSPRLLASRLNFLNPVYYARLDPFARAQAFRAARNLVLTMGSVLYAAKMAGAQVNTDPTNADFGKIKIGNTRIDLAGGFQQPVRLIAQLIEGKITSSTTGKVIHLGPQGVGHLSRKDIAQRFIEGKLAPVPSAVNDLLQGTTFAGQPLKPGSEIASRMTPLVWQDLYGIATGKGHGQGPGMAALLALPDLFGVGVQNYGAKKPKGKAGSFGGYGGGGSSNFGGYGSGGSSSFGGYGP